MPRARRAALSLAGAVLAASLALAALAGAQDSPLPGGTVPSLLELSLSDPSPFTRSGPRAYTATIRAEVTATDAPVRLSLADGETTGGPRRGHLVRGASILPVPLWAAATDSQYRSLDSSFIPPLRSWSAPVARTKATIRLRQTAPDGWVLRNHHKLLLVTLTAAGP